MPSNEQTWNEATTPNRSIIMGRLGVFAKHSQNGKQWAELPEELRKELDRVMRPGDYDYYVKCTWVDKLRANGSLK